MICRSVISYLIDFKILFSSVSESYRNGDIRLVEGRYNWEGRVEIYVSKTWSTINDSSWTNFDAGVVCRQLGHSISTEGIIIYKHFFSWQSLFIAKTHLATLPNALN